MDELLSIIKKYCDNGWCITPLVPNGKMPTQNDWVNQSTNVYEINEQIFQSVEGLGVGIVTGQRSNLFVLDVDIKHGHTGLNTLHNMEEKCGPLPETYIVKTVSGGYHYYFQYPADYPIKPSSRVGNANNGLDGVDIRSDGGQVVAPPTSIDGVKYKVLSNKPIAQIPTSWLDYIYQDKITYKQLTQSDGSSIIIALRKEFQMPEKLTAGERNDTLLRYGSSLIGKGLPYDDIIEEIIKMNEERSEGKPLSINELEATIFTSLKKYKVKHDNELLQKKVDAIKEMTPEERKEAEKSLAPWLLISNNGTTNINDDIYSKHFIQDIMSGNLYYISNQFVNINMEVISELKIAKLIQNEIGVYINSNLAPRIRNIMLLIKSQCDTTLAPSNFTNIILLIIICS